MIEFNNTFMSKIKPFSGIKAKTTIYVIIPVVVSFFIIFSILFVYLFKAQKNITETNFKHIVKMHSANFERKVISAVDYLIFVASVLEFQVYEGIADREALQRMMYYIFDGHTVGSSSIYFEPNMYDGKDEDYLGTVYGTALSGRIAYYFFRFSGRTGYRQEALENDIEFTMPLYIDTKEQNIPIYTEPVIYNIDGVDTLVFVISYPIRGMNNEFIGAITANIFLEEIYAELQAENIFKTGYMIIGNDREQIIYSPRFEDIGRYRAELGLDYSLPAETEEPETIGARSILTNEKTLVAINTIYVPQIDSRFYISVAAPVREINAERTRMMLIAISLSIAFITLIALFLYHLIGKMTEPLGAFKKSAEMISQGDYSIRIKGDYQDEFAVLKDTVNQMTERIEAHMKESKGALHILQNILNGIDAFVYVSDPKTNKLLFINDQFRKVLNIKDDTIGRQCYEVLYSGFQGICEFCPCMELDKNPDTPIIWENYNPRTKRHYHNMDCYIGWLGGEKVHLQHSIDITDLKTITEEKIKAEEISNAKSIFLASMSHEIRTPMNAIIGFSELAIDSNISLKTRNYISKIKASAESLLLIINDILDVSKIEAGKMELERIPFDINELFKFCRMIASPNAREKGLTLFCYAEPSLGRLLLGDPTRLRQVLLNLLSNAIKFTNTGIVKLLSAISGITENTVTMHFEIKDSGIGMTPEQIDMIFQPFVQGDDSTTRKYGGTGLGLTITRNLITLMGGELQVESSLGLGSRFYFDITFETIVKDADCPILTSTVSSDKKPVFEGEVLVCEDNAVNQLVISEHLARVGLKTVIAGNGKIGVDFVKSRMESLQGKLDSEKQEKQFDLIFMDIHMPEMDGLEATKNIIEMGCTTPIIALTANVMTENIKTYFEAGMRDCLSKPFVAHDLWSCLLKFLEPVSILSIMKDIDYADEEEEQRMELITAFVKSNQETINDINNALEIDDMKLAYRLVHTLKGVAGIVGMTALTQAAQVVEQSIPAGKTKLLKEQIDVLENELDAALAELSLVADFHTSRVAAQRATAKQAMNASNPDGFFHRENALKLLEKLKVLLDADSFDSLSLLNDISAIPGTEQLVEQVENMNFKEARETLAAVKRNIALEQMTENENG